MQLGHHIGPAPTNNELGITVQTQKSIAHPFQVYEHRGLYWFYTTKDDSKIEFGPYDSRDKAEWAAQETEATW